MVFYQLFHPLLFIYTKIAPRLIVGIVNTVGVRGLVALPFVSVATEKSCYDTFCAVRGIDLYKEQAEAGYNGTGDNTPVHCLSSRKYADHGTVLTHVLSAHKSC